MISYPASIGQQNSSGLHALLLGISEYPYLPDGRRAGEGQDYDLGMRQLYSPALSAVKLARWLLRFGDRLPKPLASATLLIAPSEPERKLISQMSARSDDEREMIAACAKSTADDCTFDKVKTALHKWRAACASSKENVAWFYFGGHGIEQIPGNPIMLLSGFNAKDNPVLGEALEFEHVFRGMEVTIDFKKMALQQHFVIDACRTEPRGLHRLFKETPPQPWSYLKERTGKRNYATIFGTTSGSPSFGSPKGTALSRGLLRALKGAAADAEELDASNRIWTIRHYRLLEVLQELVQQIARRLLGETQTSEPGPTSGNVLWSSVPRTPILHVRVELNPDSAHPPEAVSLQRAASMRERINLSLKRHPYTTKLEAGHYCISVTFPAGHTFQSYVGENLVRVRPPWGSCHVPLVHARAADGNK